MRKQSINLDRAVELLADPKMTYAAVGRKLADEEGRAVTYQPHSIRKALKRAKIEPPVRRSP